MLIAPNDDTHNLMANLASKKQVAKNQPFLQAVKYNLVQKSKPKLTSEGYNILMELDAGKVIHI